MPSANPPPAPAFAVRNAGFVYPDGTRALSGITFSIGAGERVAILGANGSGKSTLLRLLGGLDFAVCGEVCAFGLSLTEDALEPDAAAHAFRRRVQFVFQNADVQLFSPTVEEEVAFGPLQLGPDAESARQQAHETLDRLGILHLAPRAPHRLSGGEKRKVALASALVLKPDALLLDEPAAGLDPRSADALADILNGFHADGGTVITATHDIPRLPEIADRALVLGEDHRLRADASVADILADQGLLEECNLVSAARRAR